MKQNQLIAKFEDRQVRSVVRDGQSWWVIVDMIEALVETEYPQQYWMKMQARETIELKPNWLQLKVVASNGKGYMMDCVNFEGALRLIQSIPSSKVEPFKQWLAKIGRERAEEEVNPELAYRRTRKRAQEFYAQRGMDKGWINERLSGIHHRHELTDIFKEVGIDKKDYGKLTNINHIGTFGVNVRGHKELKGLSDGDNLRDNMIGTELAFNRFSEMSLKDKLVQRNTQNSEETSRCVESHAVAIKAAREAYERATGKRLASSETPETVDQIKLPL